MSRYGRSLVRKRGVRYVDRCRPDAESGGRPEIGCVGKAVHVELRELIDGLLVLRRVGAARNSPVPGQIEHVAPDRRCR